jgi:thiosulfate/3-mercaptopyruvate sulfurtransferase
MSEEIKAKTTTEQISDARPAATYQQGHIDQALNVWWKLLQNDDGTVKTPGEIRAIALANGVNLDFNQTTSCQSGITATWLYASYQHAGNLHTAVYDGSWAEYSDRINKTSQEAFLF